MRSPVLADTGPLYALADPSDQYHDRARKEAERLQARGGFVAVLYPTLCEAYTLVLRRLGVAYAREWLREATEGAMLINPDAADYNAAFEWMAAFSGEAITLFDGVLAAVCGRLRIPVWTYDHRFDLLRTSRWV